MSTLSTTRSTVPARPPQAPAGAASAPVIDPVKIIKRYRVALMASAVLGIVLGVGGFFVLRQFAPEYKAVAQYQILSVTGAGPNDKEISDNAFQRLAATQANLLTSDVLLKAALNRPLVGGTKWAQSYASNGSLNSAAALIALKKLASGRYINNTAIVELSVTAADPSDARDLAMAIHEAYFDRLKADFNAKQAQNRETVAAALAKKMTDLTANDQAQADLIQREQLDDTTWEEKLRNLDPAITETGQKLDAARTLKDDLEARSKQQGGINFTNDERAQAERDPIVQNLQLQLVNLQADDKAKADQGLGPNHAERIRLKTRIDSTQSEIEKAREAALRKLFDADLSNSQLVVDQLSGQLANLTSQRVAAKQALERIKQAKNRLSQLDDDRKLMANEVVNLQKAVSDVDMVTANGYKSSDHVDRVSIYSVPTTPDSLSFPRAEIIIPVGLFLVVGLTMGAIFLREILDQRIRGASDVGMIPRLRLLGTVPLASEDPSRPTSAETAFKDAPTGAISDAFRHVRVPIYKRMKHGGLKSLLVVAGAPESGATTAACNMAMGWAASDLRVLLIDANFRRPALHKILKLGEGPGLGDLLCRKVTLDAAIQQSSQANLHLLSAGSAASRTVSERLGTETMSQVIKEAGEQYDLVIIDTAPATVAGDAFALANRCDAVVLVIKALGEKRGLVARVRDQFHDVHGEFMGVIVNAVRASAGGYMRKNIKAAHAYQNNGHAS